MGTYYNLANVAIVFLLLAICTFTLSQQVTANWQTLNGSPPLVIARGGFSSLFPDSSLFAYEIAKATSVPDLVLWCDVQLTKDGSGICFSGLILNNASDVANVYGGRENSYIVDGIQTTGYFSVDFTLQELEPVSIRQALYSRPESFDGSSGIPTVEDVFVRNKPAGYWLNIQNDAFYSQQKLSMRSFVISASKKTIISHISSPDIRFLQGLAKRFASTKTKLVFRFLDKDVKEPSTNKTYGSLLKNLAFIKSFASGILVPKASIWPIDAESYLLPHTSLVLDAHKNGLEIFAADFANDNVIAYNYSYNPVAEYLSFIDNGDFSVDGVLSDSPITPSAARDCFAHVGNNGTAQAKPLVISHFGASGEYPGCTDQAYTAAILDGVDIIDCPVQMSKDGVPFCLSSINLMDSTLVTQTSFRNLLSTVNEVQSNPGIFSFSLNWTDIQGLTPVISNPFAKDYHLYRNPKFRTAGKLLSLSQFLDVAKNASSLSGVLIKIENAKYLAANQRMSIIDAVLDALDKGGYNSPTSKKVMIQSTNSAVLKALKGKIYERVYEVDEIIRDAPDAVIDDIKSFSDSVVVNQKSVYPTNQGFLLNLTNVVPHLHSFNLSVYVQALRNEFVSIAYDYFSDPIVEINTYVMGAVVDGLITDFPRTVASYKENLCLTMKNTPVYMSPVQPALLATLITEAMPPAQAPNPLLTSANVLEASLPPVPQNSSAPPTNLESPSRSPNGHHQITASALLSCMAIIVTLCLLLW